MKTKVIKSKLGEIHIGQWIKVNNKYWIVRAIYDDCILKLGRTGVFGQKIELFI